MGSVSKVQKRNEVIGGSARPEFIRKHPPTSIFQFPPCCPIQRQSSDFSYAFSSAGQQGDGSQRLSMNLFSRFCCPSQESKASLSLDPIREDASVGGELDEENLNLGCWDGFLQRFMPQTRKGKEFVSISPKGNSKHNDLYADETPPLKEGAHSLDESPGRALKHSTSSMITYGHKDAVYALKSIHLDRVSNSDFMKELKNEGKSEIVVSLSTLCLHPAASRFTSASCHPQGARPPPCGEVF